jgi:curved DNA-binding protein CbpA
MTEADPYVSLGVRQDANHDEIHDAYRKLAKLYHPDLHPGDPAAERSFKEIVAAYELLSDPLERARFDREHAESSGPDPDATGTYRDRPSGGATDARHAGVFDDRGDDAASPRRPGDDPSGFSREPMVDTWIDPETGRDHAVPKGAERWISTVFLFLALLAFVPIAVLSMFDWHAPVFDAELHAAVAEFQYYMSPRGRREQVSYGPLWIVIGILVVMVCAMMAGMKWVEGRSKRPD